jgi:adenylate kinase family enzyme
MRKVAVFGNAGGGKSTLARQLATITGLPLHVLDILPYPEGRYRPEAPAGGRLPEAEFLALQRAILGQDAWIIDGYGSLDATWARLAAADTLVFVDLPVLAHLWGVTRRLAGGLFGTPPGWPQAAPLWASSLDSYRTVWRCHRRLTPQYRRYLAEAAGGRQVHHLTSRGAMRAFLQAVRQGRSGSAAPLGHQPPAGFGSGATGRSPPAH